MGRKPHSLGDAVFLAASRSRVGTLWKALYLTTILPHPVAAP